MARILLVEDDLDLREMLKAVLVDTGFQVTDVSDGQAALDIIISWQPDLIISDIVMDGMEGIAAIIELRKLLPDIPIIAMSGNELYLRNSKMLGANVTLLKPFASSRLVSEIDALLDIPVPKRSTSS